MATQYSTDLNITINGLYGATVNNVVANKEALSATVAWNSTGTPQGLYFLSMQVTDTAGAYTSVQVPVVVTTAPDTTAPTTPVVTDDGSITYSRNQLYASWTSSDPESSVIEYQYKITQDSPTGATIRNWTSTTTYKNITAGALSLTCGKIYYFGVKAKNSVGLWSAVGYSDGITVTNRPPVLITPGSAVVKPGQTLNFTISATDADNDLLTYSAPLLPAGATFATSTRTFTWTPPSNTTIVQAVARFTVSDGKGGSITKDVVILVCQAVFPAINTVARSSWWTVSGTTLYATGGNPSVEYDVTITTAKYYYPGLTAKNISGNLPAGYNFKIILYIDGVSKGDFPILGNISEYQIGRKAVNLTAGTHRIKFVWTNDYYVAGQYDANIQIKDAFVQ